MTKIEEKKYIYNSKYAPIPRKKSKNKLKMDDSEGKQTKKTSAFSLYKLRD